MLAARLVLTVVPVGELHALARRGHTSGRGSRSPRAPRSRSSYRSSPPVARRRRDQPLPAAGGGTAGAAVVREAHRPCASPMASRTRAAGRASRTRTSRGIGRTRRVVLWDTLLDAPREEVEVVVAHELVPPPNASRREGDGFVADDGRSSPYCGSCCRTPTRTTLRSRAFLPCKARAARLAVRERAEVKRAADRVQLLAHDRRGRRRIQRPPCLRSRIGRPHAAARVLWLLDRTRRRPTASRRHIDTSGSTDATSWSEGCSR